ncbi:tetratricopeptide repeat protein [Pelagovum pacificum]|uniref:Tetratricopeptide repeat protein n=1 Tax=Pelagovum pacificum TaxID=2588711 RepID=A0A5C5G9Q0_9RHOB|nr:tetratricopeptide repeat protein [Pelagovum pacificum]QQA41849.1 tetratricopeptide repeat protein [Pelagovum pacificum]TNY30708.1 tetratricopeptide repeat protein [Pelagovum pacificum]
MPADDPGQSRLAAEAARLAAAPALSRSARNRELLDYLVRETEAGRAGRVTETAIAQDLMDRDAGFDPASDPIVRVRMRRLRDAIAAAYAEEPERTGDRIELPRGGYTVVLVEGSPAEPAPAAEPTAKTRRRHPALLAAAVLLLLALIGGFAYSGSSLSRLIAQFSEPVIRDYPVVSVERLRNMTGDAANDVFEAGFQSQLASDLQRFDRVRVVAPTSSGEMEIKPDYRLSGEILALEPQVDLVLRLSRTDHAGALVHRRFTRTAGENYFELLAEISEEASGRLGGPGGDFSQAAEQTMAKNLGLPDSDNLAAFRCVMETDRFLFDYEPEQFDVAWNCIEPLAQDSTDPTVLAAWSALVTHSVPEFQMMDTSAISTRHTPEEALNAAEHIVAVNPLSDTAFLQFGAVLNVQGNSEAAIAALSRARALNPGNPTAAAVLAYAYMANDRFEEAGTEAEAAIRRSAVPAPYMYVPLFVAAVVEGDGEAAMEAAEAYAPQAGPGVDTVRLIAAKVAGRSDIVDELAPVVARLDDPLYGLSAFVQGPVGTSALRDALISTGVSLEDS